MQARPFITHVEYCLALQGRINGFEVLTFQQKPIAAHVPSDVAGIGHNLLIWRSGNEPFFCLFKVTLVAEWKRLC